MSQTLQGNGTESTVRDEVRRVLAELGEPGPAAPYVRRDVEPLRTAIDRCIGAELEYPEGTVQRVSPKVVVAAVQRKMEFEPFSTKQPYILIGGLSRRVAEAVAISRNHRQVTKQNESRRWCFVGSSGDDWRVIQLLTPADWIAECASDIPPNIEIATDGHRKCKQRNRHVGGAKLELVQWWIPIYRLPNSEDACCPSCGSLRRKRD